jgi:hypothetical protein
LVRPTNVGPAEHRLGESSFKKDAFGLRSCREYLWAQTNLIHF